MLMYYAVTNSQVCVCYTFYSVIFAVKAIALSGIYDLTSRFFIMRRKSSSNVKFVPSLSQPRLSYINTCLRNIQMYLNVSSKSLNHYRLWLIRYKLMNCWFISCLLFKNHYYYYYCYYLYYFNFASCNKRDLEAFEVCPLPTCHTYIE